MERRPNTSSVRRLLSPEDQYILLTPDGARHTTTWMDLSATLARVQAQWPDEEIEVRYVHSRDTSAA